jgi:transcriptional regulator with XRE-family HTH domain
MVISDRLRELRQQKGLSQGDIQVRSGLLRCYISRVENGHTVPSIDTLEKLARALQVPMYELFYDGEKPPEPRNPSNWNTASEALWGSSGAEEKMLHRFRWHLSRTKERDLKLLMSLAQKMAKKHRLKAVRSQP